MGVRSVLKTDPVRLARNLLDSRDDVVRIIRQRTRRLMLEDNSESVVKNVIGKVFSDATVRSKVSAFAALARSQALFKRIVSELARPAYMVPPVRTISTPEDQARFNAIASASRLDCVLDNALRLAIAQNHSFIMARYAGERLDRIVLQVLPADVVRVIPDPEDPLRAMAVMYDYQVLLRDGSTVIWHQYIDENEKFRIDHNGNLAAPIETNMIGKINIMEMHAAPRYESYWNITHGDDLVEGENACSLLTLLALRKLKARGFRALVLKGDMVQFPKGQVLDEESGLMVPEGMDVQELGQEADAANYLAMIDSLTKTVAANHGISRARLNQESTGTSSDVGLMEQRSEIIKFLRPAEQELFDIIKLVSREFGDERTLSESASMSIDYGEIATRTDPETDLRVWETKRRRGVANILDQIKAENPEVRTDEEAIAELDRNLLYESEYVKRIRALNMPMDADVEDPGKSPEENGADGGAASRETEGDDNEPSNNPPSER